MVGGAGEFLARAYIILYIIWREKRGIFLTRKNISRKIKFFSKKSFKRLTVACKFGIIDRLCNSALYGLTREVTEISKLKPL